MKIRIKINKDSEQKIIKLFNNELEKNEHFFIQTLGTVFNDIITDKREYEMESAQYGYLYSNKYYYRINELLLALNAYLIKNYIILNKKNILKDAEWENIYEKHNPINNITYLLTFLIGNVKDINKSDLLDMLYKIYIYENLFRHQICHGWINEFTNNNGFKENLIYLKTYDELDNFLKLRKQIKILNKNFEKDNKNSFDNLRKVLKTEQNNSPKHSTLHNMYDNLRLVSSILTKENNQEPSITIKVDNKALLKLQKEEWVNSIIDKKEMIIEYIDYKLAKEYVEWHFSLNRLTELIIEIVNIIQRNYD